MEAKASSQEAKSQEAKAGQAAGAAATGDDDLSMEEILQSIRRIITEDDKDGKKPAEVKTNGTKAKETKEDDVPGSDVFELTDMVKDDGSVVNVKAEKSAEPEGKDVLNKIDEALAPLEPEVKVEAPPAPAPAEPSPVESAPVAPDDSLLSDEAAAASMSSFNKLKAAEQPTLPATGTPAPSFRDGTTMEDLVTEMLRPMMKTWLDANLPQIVERIVEREVRKLTK